MTQSRLLCTEKLIFHIRVTYLLQETLESVPKATIPLNYCDDRLRVRLALANWRRKVLHRSTQILGFLPTSFNTTLNLASRSNGNIFGEFNLLWKSHRTLHNLTKADQSSTSESEISILGEQNENKGIVVDINHIKHGKNTKKIFPVSKKPWRRATEPNHRFWAFDILTDYLSLKDCALREEYWNDIKSKICGKFLPTILVQFMHRTSCSLSSFTPLDLSISIIANNTLESQGLNWDDVEYWAYILNAGCPDLMTTRLCESSHQRQSFILLYILKHDLNSNYTLEKLNICMWDLIFGEKNHGQAAHIQCHSRLENPISHEKTTPYDLNASINKIPKCDFDNSAQKSSYPRQEIPIDLYTFMDLAKLLLRNARRIWPALMVNVAQMASTFARLYVAMSKCDPKSLDPQTSRKLCYLLNNLLVSLSYLSNFEPYVLIVHNWESQKILLKLAAEFHPALILSRASYRAIIQVLAAHQKTSGQRISVLRRSRGWPPWPIVQHGMDIDRLTHEKESQVVAGIGRLKEAGYGGDWFDDALRIIGGQEFDGTPSIQTRKMLPWPKLESSLPDGLNPNLWAARVTATRDIHEAWSAFSEFRKKGGQPNQEIFFSMFKKLAYDLIRDGRRRNYDKVVPGDGLEVLPVPENNYSDYYKRHLEPPSIGDLYSEMTASGIVPKNGLLSFLVRTSRTPDEGFRYLYASGVEMCVLRALASIGNPQDHKHILEVPRRVFSDVIYLICRFVPKLVQISPMLENSTECSKWTIHHLKSKSSFGLSLDKPLCLAAYLLKIRRPKSSPPWYSFFTALTRESSIVSWEYAGYPENDILAWRMLRSSFNDFTKNGLHLNTRGFSIICHGFEKYMRAVFQSNIAHKTEIENACKFLKNEFRKLTTTGCRKYNSPEYYQSIRGIHLHAYVRCLALVKDNEEIMSTLEWMTSNSNELEKTSRQEGPNSKCIFRRVLVVIGMSIRDTCFENRARYLISSVDGWDGWPKDDEVEVYRLNSPKRVEYLTKINSPEQ